MAKPTKKSRSGTKWTKDVYTAAGYAPPLFLRLKQGAADKLLAIAERRTMSRAQVVTDLVEREMKRLKRIAKKIQL